MMSNDYGPLFAQQRLGEPEDFESELPLDPDDYPETQPTQPSSQQATQPADSQSQGSQNRDSHCWGYLQPVNDKLARIDFWKSTPIYTIGRHHTNIIVLPGFKVSNKHCEIEWNGQEGKGGIVVVRDYSSNGTFINGQKIGKDITRVLREGNEIAFGSPSPQPQNQMEDYRFIYRHMAAGIPTTGLYAFYDIGTELGKGSFATVMKAINRSTGIWYAVKMIKDKSKRGTTDGETVGGGGIIKNTSIAREIGIMEALKHPNICDLKEVFVEEDSADINLVMELIEGGDLLEYILSRNGLSEPEAQHITFQICNALSYVHASGITHRDLKPENILLTKDDPPIVKIADFGLAKIVDSLTMLRTMCGTPSYLAPEVVNQGPSEGYTSVVDSWSVGVIVFSMLTNSSPFIEDEGQTNLRIRIIERVIDWDNLRNRGVSEDAFNFIQRLMDEDPGTRMTLTDALYHPWLKAYQAANHAAALEEYSPPSTQTDSQGPSTGVTRHLIGLGLHSRTSPPRATPLQRRSIIMNQAAEGTRAVPQPPPEMIAHSHALDEEEEEASQRLSQSQSQSQETVQPTRGKRVRASLDPVDEDEDEDDDDDGGSSSSGGTARGASGGGQATRSKRPRLRSEA